MRSPALEHKPPKVIGRKGTKKIHCHTLGNKAQITILACANVAGTTLPPMVIFDGQSFNPEWSKGEVPNTLYGMSDKGWTDQELFFYWMTQLFVKSPRSQGVNVGDFSTASEPMEVITGDIEQFR